jgi:hypothetical protein
MAIFKGSSPIESIANGFLSAARPPSARARATPGNAFRYESYSCPDRHCGSLALTGPCYQRSVAALPTSYATRTLWVVRDASLCPSFRSLRGLSTPANLGNI